MAFGCLDRGLLPLIWRLSLGAEASLWTLRITRNSAGQVFSTWLGVFGYGVILMYYPDGFKGLPMHINIMMTLGIIMMLIFFHVFFAPFKRLKKAVEAQDWPTGGKALTQIRHLVGINMIIGLITAAIATGGAGFF